MMVHMKYMIIKGAYGLELPIIFDQTIGHLNMAQNIVDPNRWATEGELKQSILSAGFVIINPDGGVQCYGESVTLEIRSQEGDSDLINKMLGQDE